MERGIQRGDENIQPPIIGHPIIGHHYTSSGLLYALKRGKYPADAVEHDQQVDTREKDHAEKKDALCCAACKYPITREQDRIQVNEQHQHVFANPHGYIFQIGCFAQAPGCLIAGEETAFFSWFPGYTWRYALCGQCGTLLGWAFRSQMSQFLGLILDRLTQEQL
jgi:hypothetical protein